MKETEVQRSVLLGQRAKQQEKEREKEREVLFIYPKFGNSSVAVESEYKYLKIQDTIFQIVF